MTENGQHYRYKSTVELKRKSDWDSKNKKIKPSEPMFEEWQAKLDALYNKADNIRENLEKGGTASADKIIEELRFGAHSESFLVLAEQKVSECPACNVQLIFYRADGKAPVLVKFLLNEKETLIHGLKPLTGCYYEWSKVKEFWANR